MTTLIEDIRTFILMNGGIDNKFREFNRLFKSVQYTVNHILSAETKFNLDGDFVNPFLNESGFQHKQN